MKIAEVKKMLNAETVTSRDLESQEFTINVHTSQKTNKLYWKHGEALHKLTSHWILNGGKVILNMRDIDHADDAFYFTLFQPFFEHLPKEELNERFEIITYPMGSKMECKPGIMLGMTMYYTEHPHLIEELKAKG